MGNGDCTDLGPHGGGYLVGGLMPDQLPYRLGNAAGNVSVHLKVFRCLVYLVETRFYRLSLSGRSLIRFYLPPISLAFQSLGTAATFHAETVVGAHRPVTAAPKVGMLLPANNLTPTCVPPIQPLSRFQDSHRTFSELDLTKKLELRRKTCLQKSLCRMLAP